MPLKEVAKLSAFVSCLLQKELASILVLNFNFLPAKGIMDPASMTSLEIWDIIYLHSWPSSCSTGKRVAELLPLWTVHCDMCQMQGCADATNPDHPFVPHCKIH